MARLSVSIMAHPTRAGQVGLLTERLDRDDVPVAWAKNPQPSAAPADRWRTGRRAWMMHDPDADYHMVIQDDAIPCGDLIAGLEKALDHMPAGDIGSAYFGNRTGPMSRKDADLAAIRLAMAERARQQDASWIVSRTLGWGLAVIIPTRHIEPMVAACSTAYGQPYDLRIGKYFRDRLRVLTWYTWPSLVDHHEGPSLINHNDRAGRQAHQHHAESALDLDWTRRAVHDDALARV